MIMIMAAYDDEMMVYGHRQACFQFDPQASKSQAQMHRNPKRGQSPSACRESGPLMTYPGWDYRRPSVLHSGLNVGRPPEA